MLGLRKVAVTGGLSCGKSSVCRFFKELGAYAVSADEIAHQLLSPKTHLGQQVIALLGQDIVVNNQIERSLIAKKVFNKPGLLKALEQIMHPAIFAEIEKQYAKAQNQGNAPLFIVEVPLLFESGWETYFDDIIAVYAAPNLCRQRYIASTGNNAEEYDKRITNQLSPVDKVKRADYVIENNGRLEDTQKETETIYRKIVSLNKPS